MRFYSMKIIKLANADIHLHYANNKGRGQDNVTITIVETGQTRPQYTRMYNGFLTQYRTSGWHGVVNIDNDTIAEYGGLQIVGNGDPI